MIGRKSSFLWVLVLSLASVIPLTAGSIIQPVSATTDGGEKAGFPLTRLIDQSGLTATYVSGVTGFDTFTAATRHTRFDSEWLSTSIPAHGLPLPEVVFDLGAVFAIDKAAIWNSFFYPVRTITLLSTPDKIHFNPIGGFLLPNTEGETGGVATEVLTFPRVVDARFIYLDIVDAYSPTAVGLGEVAFDSPAPEPAPVPETASLILLATGLLGLGLIRQRHLPIFRRF